MRYSLLILCVVLAGCSKGHPSTAPQDPVIIGDPSPQLTMQRLVSAYEQKKPVEYQDAFTGDFRFEFSNVTDPNLVQQYAGGWFKTDEKESSNHLFTGYTDPGGGQLPAATSIVIHLATDIPTDDNASGEPDTHKVLLTRVDGSVTVPQSGGEPLTYLITNNYHAFYLVRGDAADSLDFTQPADSLHWYVYRWVDLTGTAPKASGPATKETTTWAEVKATYR
jgi:hypothetical protein